MLNKKALAGSASTPTLNVADVFSADTYTGNTSTVAINNGIDLSSNGGMVWVKSRGALGEPLVWDTVRGRTYALKTHSTGGNVGPSSANKDLVSFNSNGFTVGQEEYVTPNNNGTTYVGWTFRKAEKFFDVVTYTGTGSNRTVNHNLGSVPGMIWVKKTSASGNNWSVYHTHGGNTRSLFLNTTGTGTVNSEYWNNTSPTSTQFTVGTGSTVNDNGATYIAYLFANETDSASVIKCGGWTVGSGTTTIDLGWTPQFVLVKQYGTNGGSWTIMDTARGFPTSGNEELLYANSTTTEESRDYFDRTTTGFKSYDSIWADVGASALYLAIKSE